MPQSTEGTAGRRSQRIKGGSKIDVEYSRLQRFQTVGGPMQQLNRACPIGNSLGTCQSHGVQSAFDALGGLRERVLRKGRHRLHDSGSLLRRGDRPPLERGQPRAVGGLDAQATNCDEAL